MRWTRAWRRAGLVTGIALLVLLALLVVADVVLDRPLRARMERALNDSLIGYSARLERLDVHVWGGSLDLYGLSVAQVAHPEPPIGVFPRLSASIQWKSLLRGRVVADVELYQPALHVDLTQLLEESADEVPVEDKGWQDAVEAIYPFKINELLVYGGNLVYVDQDPERPLRLSRIEFQADNIRNVHSRDRTYPSRFRLDATMLEQGSLALEGSADFMARPQAGVAGRITLRNIPLGYFSPVLERTGITTRGGTLALDGSLEYGRTIHSMILDDIEIADADVEYGYAQPEAVDQQKMKEQTVQAAQELQDAPRTLTRVDRLRLTGSRFTVANHTARPVYKVFLSDLDLDVRNISNQPEDGAATARMTGKFMGSGRVRGSAAFWPSSSADFSLALSVENTRMDTLNEVFRAHGNFDVSAGWLSVYTEMRLKRGHVQGWVKPLFSEVDVYNATQDRDEGFWHRLWEKTVGVASKLLRNRPRKEVATVVDISGRLENPRASTVQIVANLVRNAFVKAILPGLQRESSGKAPDGKKKKEDRSGA